MDRTVDGPPDLDWRKYLIMKNKHRASTRITIKWLMVHYLSFFSFLFSFVPFGLLFGNARLRLDERFARVRPENRLFLLAVLLFAIVVVVGRRSPVLLPILNPHGDNDDGSTGSLSHSLTHLAVAPTSSYIIIVVRQQKTNHRKRTKPHSICNLQFYTIII